MNTRLNVLPHIRSTLKILLVEDARDNQLLVDLYLKKAGIQMLDIANNGKEAIELIALNSYDCVLMDIQMPIMDGPDATRILREMGYQKKIIALTAYTSEAEKERYRAFGFDEYIAKPINQKILLEKLSEL